MSADKHDVRPRATQRDGKPATDVTDVTDATDALGARSGKSAHGSARADDVVLVHSRSQDGKGLNVIRKRGDSLCAGQVRPVEEGKPLSGDLVSLEPRAESPALFDVVTHYRADAQPQETPRAQLNAGDARSGPARVNSAGYRSGWDSIWGKKSRKSSLN